ncbi:hypothetical protein Tco_1439583 [Tanacetum coccineum]
MPNCPVCKESRYKKKTKAGKAWKYFDMMKPEFSGDARNVRLGLAADGFNPFGMMSQTYSMWPVILTTYNTHVVNYGNEVWTKDAATGIISNERRSDGTINDFPARSSLSGWSGQGYYACPTCNVDTPSMAVKNKIAYVGHRRFLRTRHPQRSKFKEYYERQNQAVKARQETWRNFECSKELLVSKKPNGKLEKPHPEVSFTTEGKKSFVIHIKGVNYLMVWIQLQAKVTADDNNITGMKSHDCHIMMHRFVSNLMQKNVRAKKQSISILIELEQIFPPAFFDIMIHVAIHLPDEAILGGPIRYSCMFVLNNSLESTRSWLTEKKSPDNVETIFPRGSNPPSGVLTLAGWREGYYGQLEEILELTYIGNQVDAYSNDENANANEGNAEVMSRHMSLMMMMLLWRAYFPDPPTPRGMGMPVVVTRRPNGPLRFPTCVRTILQAINSSMVNSLMGETVKYLPLACEWEEIPEAYKAHIFPTLEGKAWAAIGIICRDGKVWGGQNEMSGITWIDWWSHPDRVARSFRNACQLERRTRLLTPSWKKIILRKAGTKCKSMQDLVRAGSSVQDRIKISWMEVGQSNRQKHVGKGRKYGWWLNFRRAVLSIPDDISREEMGPDIEAKRSRAELLRKQTQEAQTAYLVH